MSSTLAWAVSIQPEEDELANTTVLFLQADRKRRQEARLYTCRQLCSLFARDYSFSANCVSPEIFRPQGFREIAPIELTLFPALRLWN